MTEAGTSLRMCSLEQRCFQSSPPSRPASLIGHTEDCTRSLDCFNSSIQVLISCHARLPMPCRESEDDDNAPQQPCFTAPKKASRNDGAMPVQMLKEPKMNLIPMLSNNSMGRRAKSESAILSSDTLKSSDGKPAPIPNWSPHKSIMKFTRS